MKKSWLIICMLTFFVTGTFAQKGGEVKHLNDNTFKTEVFDYVNAKEWKFLGNKPVIVDFYATWCGPCRKLAPVLKELQKEYGDAIQIYKVDTDKAPNVSAAFGIRSIPSLLFIPMKGKPTMAQGALPKESLQKAIKEILGVDQSK